jgi:hypothetical protein
MKAIDARGSVAEDVSTIISSLDGFVTSDYLDAVPCSISSAAALDPTGDAHEPHERGVHL